jgi:hypothetical protein
MSSWYYGIVKREDGALVLAEIYTDSGGNPALWGEVTTADVTFAGEDEYDAANMLRHTLAMMLADSFRPIIGHDEFDSAEFDEIARSIESGEAKTVPIEDLLAELNEGEDG